MNRKISDVYFERVRLDSVPVFCHRETSSKESFLQRGEEGFRGVYQDIIACRNLKHAGTMYFSSSGYLPGQYALSSIRFVSCGGDAALEDFEEKSEKGKWQFGKKIICRSHAGMVMQVRHSMAEMGDLMLHLLLKQMVPALTFCNYIDCGFEGASGAKIEIDEEARQLGVVAFMRSAFISDLSGGGNFGFILMPGMRTTMGCDGLDKWLQYLVLRKFWQLRDFLIFSKPAIFSSLLGPKE